MKKFFIISVISLLSNANANELILQSTFRSGNQSVTPPKLLSELRFFLSKNNLTNHIITHCYEKDVNSFIEGKKESVQIVKKVNQFSNKVQKILNESILEDFFVFGELAESENNPNGENYDDVFAKNYLNIEDKPSLIVLTKEIQKRKDLSLLKLELISQKKEDLYVVLEKKNIIKINQIIPKLNGYLITKNKQIKSIDFQYGFEDLPKLLIANMYCLEKINTKSLKNLKFLSIYSTSINSFDPTGLANLEKLQLRENENLQIFKGDGLENLIQLDIRECDLRNFYGIGMEKLLRLNVSGNFFLRSLDCSPMPNLRQLNITDNINLSIKSLPNNCEVEKKDSWKFNVSVWEGILM
jgi:hypothetical protein